MNDYTAKDLSDNEPEDHGDNDKRAFDEMNSQVSFAYPLTVTCFIFIT